MTESGSVRQSWAIRLETLVWAGEEEEEDEVVVVVVVAVEKVEPAPALLRETGLPEDAAKEEGCVKDDASEGLVAEVVAVAA